MLLHICLEKGYTYKEASQDLMRQLKKKLKHLTNGVLFHPDNKKAHKCRTDG